jgi:hypothetical protein
MTHKLILANNHRPLASVSGGKVLGVSKAPSSVRTIPVLIESDIEALESIRSDQRYTLENSAAMYVGVKSLRLKK